MDFDLLANDALSAIVKSQKRHGVIRSCDWLLVRRSLYSS